MRYFVPIIDTECYRLLLLMENVRVRGMPFVRFAVVLYVITRDAILLSVSPKPTNWKRVEI